MGNPQVEEIIVPLEFFLRKCYNTIMDLAGKRVLITGVGIKPVEHVFRDITTGKPSHTSVKANGVEFKANIGAATALECAKVGAVVHIVSHTEGKLKIIKDWIKKSVPKAKVEYTAIDLGDEQVLKQFVNGLKRDLPLYWVQSVGLGAGTVKIKDDNPYLAIEDLSVNLVEAELSVLRNTVTLLQLLLPRFKKQKETRVCIISSMSAIRSYTHGSIHTAAKGAMSRFTNAAMIELAPHKIYITDMRPGGADTGMYDAKQVRKTVEMIAKTFGTDWSEKAGGLRLASPISVGKAVVSALTSEGHITSINLVARGQWPHEGS